MERGDGVIAPAVAREWVGELQQLQNRTRTIRQAFWLPLVLLGLIIVASTPLYFLPSQAASLGLQAGVVFKSRPASMALSLAVPGQASQEINGRMYVLPTCTATHGIVYTPCGSTSYRNGINYFPGGVFTASPRAIAIYWLIALPIAYLLIAWWYFSRGRRRGVSTSALSYVLVGIGLLALLVLTSARMSELLHLPAWTHVFVVGDLVVRGLVPLLTIGLGLFVLSYVERSRRSRALAVFSAAFFALALLVNLYDLENVAGRLGYSVGPEIGVFIAGLFMLGGGTGFALVRRRGT
jgi:hypothetical protein